MLNTVLAFILDYFNAPTIFEDNFTKEFEHFQLKHKPWMNLQSLEEVLEAQQMLATDLSHQHLPKVFRIVYEPLQKAFNFALFSAIALYHRKEETLSESLNLLTTTLQITRRSPKLVGEFQVFWKPPAGCFKLSGENSCPSRTQPGNQRCGILKNLA